MRSPCTVVGRRSWTGWPMMARRHVASLDELLLQRDVEDFCAYECELFDSRDLRSWLDLVTDDIEYTMPLRRNVQFGEWERERTPDDLGVMWFADDKVTLRQRV